MAIAGLILALGVVFPGAAGGPGMVSIPTVHGSTFAGESVALPEALRGKVGLLIVGFSQTSRTEASDWGHRLADDPQRPAGLAYYELPVLESVPRLLRGLVLKKIKESVSQNGQAHFLPVLDHEAEWKQAAGFSKADDAYVLVVDGNGAVRWRMEGPPTDAAYAEVKRQAALVNAR
jgi:hypothetical protein